MPPQHSPGDREWSRDPMWEDSLPTWATPTHPLAESARRTAGTRRWVMLGSVIVAVLLALAVPLWLVRGSGDATSPTAAVAPTGTATSAAQGGAASTPVPTTLLPTATIAKPTATPRWGGVGLLWPNAPHWPPEIDDCEYNTDTRNDCVVSLHYDPDNKWQGIHVGGDYTQWHIYTIDWLPNDLRFLIDGQMIFETTRSVPSEPMWFALQVEANPDATQLGAYWVDWVHISRWLSA